MQPRTFRKKPVAIEAMQLEDYNVQEIVKWINSATVGWQTDPPTIWIDTLEGRMTAQEGDWIIRGINGEFYPCKDDIFVRTYQEV